MTWRRCGARSVCCAPLDSSCTSIGCRTCSAPRRNPIGQDFARLWSDPALRPTRLKIYPCSIIEGTELYRLWQAGEYRPYTDDELIDSGGGLQGDHPAYCRVNRVFRDIPADDIVAGVKSSNLRQLVHERMAERGQVCRCIRCREVRETSVTESDLHQVVHAYDTRGRPGAVHEL